MDHKNLFLFIFIFLINTKILVYSQDGGNISLVYKEWHSLSTDSFIHNYEYINVSLTVDEKNRIITFSFIDGFKDFSGFFYKTLAEGTRIIITTVNLSNLKIIPNNLKELFSGFSGLTNIEGLSK